jgi:hypothetical protein
MNITHIVSVGSVDGVCTSAALLRLIGNSEVSLQFTQAFTVDKVDVSKWAPEQKVAFVDLAVNNRDKSMTEGLVRRIREAGHEIVAVIDEHSREDWLEVLGTFEGLEIEPQSQTGGTFKSSGAILKAAVGSKTDSHTIELMDAADAGDRMDFSTHFGGIVNQAVKSDIGNDTRRVYLAKHLATSIDADETIREWMTEYEMILASHQEIIAAKVELGDGIVRVVTIDKKVDMTTLMGTLYRGGAKVVVLEGVQFNKAAGCKMPMVSFGASDQKLDLLTPIKAVVSSASGFTSKVNVDPKDEAAALEIVRAVLRS